MKTVLIADEDVVLRGALKKIIEERDFKVVSCVGDTESMMKESLKYKPDIILSEIKFPDGNGLACAKQIREECPRSEFLILSAYRNPAFIKEAFTIRAKAYLSKPVSGQKIRAALDCFKTDARDSSEIIKALQDVIESRDYSKAYREPARISEEIMELCDGDPETVAEILKAIKVRLFSRYVENPYQDDSFTERFPINTELMNNRILVEMWISNVVDHLYKHRFIERYKSVGPVFEYIDEHIKDNISVGQIVDSCHISHQYILRMFKDQMGMSALDYIQNRKMMLAKWYLHFEKSATLNVAVKLGYEDGGYFAKIFRKFEGVTPHQYRVRLRDRQSKGA